MRYHQFSSAQTALLTSVAAKLINLCPSPNILNAVFKRASQKKGLSFISNRQRRNEGTFCASELAGIEPTQPAPKGAGYVRLDHSATVGILDHKFRKRVV